jgi:YtoQ family protein
MVRTEPSMVEPDRNERGPTLNELVIYAAGEIHSEWRVELHEALESRGVDAFLVGPQEVHERSDDIGESILGEQPTARYRDLEGARVNTLRTRVLMQRAELAVAYFGPDYKQWNTAVDAGWALASGLPLVLIRSPEHIHALKELDALAALTVETFEQAAEAIAYIFE